MGENKPRHTAEIAREAGVKPRGDAAEQARAASGRRSS
jgi:hypothetical protein